MQCLGISEYLAEHAEKSQEFFSAGFAVSAFSVIVQTP
jgi:hypothetical protein